MPRALSAKAIATVLMLAAVALLALAAGAVAKAGPRAGRDQVVTTMRLHGTHGYVLQVVGISGRGITVTAERAVSHYGEVLVDYLLPNADLSGPDLKFRLGDAGRVDLHFVPRQIKAGRVSAGCRGTPPSFEKGVFVGSIRFRGEADFTQVDAHRVRGSVTREGTVHCPKAGAKGESKTDHLGVGGPGGPISPAQERTEDQTLRLIAGSRSGHLKFVATSFEDPAFPETADRTFLASDYRREGELEVFRAAAVLIAPPSTLVTPDPAKPLSAATVEPPAPFSGSASFTLQSPTSSEFSGDLTVELSGLGLMPLTGAGIEAGICKGSTCTKTLPRALRPRPADSEAFAVSYFSGSAEGRARN